MITNFKVSFVKDGVTKIVGQYDDKMLIDVQIAGYIRSPYEQRIAMVVCSVTRGWEGPPHPVDCSFIGCHLEKGF